MLNLVGLADRADAPVSTLSGGQKQRIAIARALATEPDILFCDEATSALDPQTTQSILDLIRQIQAKMNLTVVMITHQMEVVRDACSLVAVVDDGRVVEQGTVSDVFYLPKVPRYKGFYLPHYSGSAADFALVRGRWQIHSAFCWQRHGQASAKRFVQKNRRRPEHTCGRHTKPAG